MRTLIVIAALCAAAARAQPPVTPGGPVAPAAMPSVPLPVTDIAQAYTPTAGQQRLEVDPWDPSGPTLGDTLGARVDYFTVEPAPIVLASGASFNLTDLTIRAFSLNGLPVEAAPLKLSLEAPPNVIDLERAVATQRLLALRRGIGRLWIESQLPRGTGTGERFRLPVVIIVR